MTRTLLWSACLIFLLGIGCKKGAETQASAGTMDFQEARRMLADGRKATEKAIQLHKEGRTEETEQTAREAYATLNKLSAESPDYVNAASTYLGQAAYLFQKYPEAKRAFSRALAVDLKDNDALKWMGFTHLAASSPNSAQDYFAKAITYFDSPDNRADIVAEMYRIGNKAYEYGVSYGQTGYPKKGYEYRAYGTYVLALGYELDKYDSHPTIKQQIRAFASALLPDAQAKQDQTRINLCENIFREITSN